MKKINNEIQKLLDQHGEVLFRMSLQHLFMTGSNNFDDTAMQSSKEACIEEEAQLKKDGKISIMTAAFKIAIIDCAGALSLINFWDIMYFVKKQLHIG